VKRRDRRSACWSDIVQPIRPMTLRCPAW
jgi:hypothetical protein